MYDYFIGNPTEFKAGRLSLEVGGVGYEIILGDALDFSSDLSSENPLASLASLASLTSPKPVIPAPDHSDKPLKIYTHFHTTEHKTALYGFVTRLKRETFRLLIRAPGVGPQSALNIVLSESPETILNLLAMKDKTGLAQFKGLGERTAAKIVLELAKPAEMLLKELGATSSAKTTSSKQDLKFPDLKFPLAQDLRAALETLGYKEQEITGVLEKFQTSPNADSATLEEALRETLELLSGR